MSSGVDNWVLRAQTETSACKYKLVCGRWEGVQREDIWLPMVDSADVWQKPAQY